MKENLQDQMQAYLEGSLEEPQLSTFLAALEENPSLKEELDDLKEMDTVMHALGAESLAEAVKGWETEYKSQRSENKVRRLSVRRVLSIAAGVAIVTSFIFLLRNPQSSPGEIYASYYEPYENLLISRGENDDIILERAMDAYDNQDYQRATSLLQPFLEANPEMKSTALYLGICLIELGEYDAADVNFALAMEDPLYRQQAQWYRALLYLKQNNIGQAKDILANIAADPNHYRREDAREINDKLDN